VSNFDLLTRSPHLPIRSFVWGRSVIDLKVPVESLSTARTSQFAWEIRAQNQSVLLLRRTYKHKHTHTHTRSLSLSFTHIPDTHTRTHIHMHKHTHAHIYSRTQDGIAALGEFMRADMSKIRNKSAYFSGVVSRFKEDGCESNF